MRTRRVVCAALSLLLSASALAAQDNAFDLRFAEFNADGHVTYQNFIYARVLRDGRFVVQANYLHIPRDKYNEVAGAFGVRTATLGDASVYVLLGAGHATDANYFEPAVFVQDVKGRFTGALYLQRYVAVNNAGVDQWLLDMLEAQYAVRGRLYLGGALYAYRADGSAWLTKVGPKLGVTDRFGATEVRVAHVNRDGSPEIQLRRIVVF